MFCSLMHSASLCHFFGELRSLILFDYYSNVYCDYAYFGVVACVSVIFRGLIIMALYLFPQSLSCAHFMLQPEIILPMFSFGVFIGIDF